RVVIEANANNDEAHIKIDVGFFPDRRVLGYSGTIFSPNIRLSNFLNLRSYHMIYKTCKKCRKKYEYGEKCSCLNKHNKAMQAMKGVEDDFYISPEWREMRELVLERDKKHCQRCWHKYFLINSTSLEVHHIKARSQFRKLELEPTNLVTVCKTCNLQLGTKGVDWDHKIIPLLEYTL
ncbi:HNH endonuclease, partial [Peribacillus frigoritolerans]|uniref:HNH endonuclease n=1 Tax=Peribacillus frigoritolerans TaxID=450367 RepID=UPI003644F735